mgnify:CR=1 FL=1
MIFQTQIKGSGGGSAPAHYVEKTVDGNGKLVNKTTTVIDLTGVTDVGDWALAYAYYNDTLLTGSVDLSSLTDISGESACQRAFSATGIISVDLSGLTTISGMNACLEMFSECSALISIDLSSLVEIYEYACQSMFDYCDLLASVNLSSLSVIGSGACNYMFSGCTSLTSLSFPALTTTSFGSYTDQFMGMCEGISGITLHFPSNLQSVIEGLDGYSETEPFGAISGTVLFDLPETE